MSFFTITADFQSAVLTTDAPMTSYSDRLHSAIQRTRTPALVGIDPRWDWLPPEIREAAAAQPGGRSDQMAWGFERFSMQLIDIVGSLVPAVKPQVAFFEQLGPAGFSALRNVMQAARRSGLIVIADAKRGDIGSTAEAYAQAWLAGDDPHRAEWPADALTVNPYLGVDSLIPFVQLAVQRRAGVYVLVRTSNPGAADFQDRTTGGETVSDVVADAVEVLSRNSRTSDRGYGCVGAVVGATWPDQLKALRSRLPSVPLLIPGFGSQGGSATDVASAFDPHGLGALVNNSRGINFAWRRSPYSELFVEARWQDAVLAATRDMIAELAAVCPL